MPELMTKQDAIEYLLYMKHDVQAKSPIDIALDTAIEALKQPTIEPEVRHGRWAKAADKQYCTECRAVTKVRNAPFCWHCGAKIDLRTPTEVALDIADSVMNAIREEYDRHKAMYDLYHHTERGGIVQGLSYASMILVKQPEVPDIDRAAILRLCNEVEDLAEDIGNHTMMDVVYAEARMIFDKAKEIGKELAGDAGTD